jgi:hypothetical protein
MRVRIGIKGKLFGVLPICWTLIAEDVDGKEIAIKEKYLTGSIFVTLTPKEG